MVAPAVYAGNSNIHTTGQIEVDFFGAQPTDATEATVFTTPALRLRLFYVRLETPAVDVAGRPVPRPVRVGRPGLLPEQRRLPRRSPARSITATRRSALSKIDPASRRCPGRHRRRRRAPGAAGRRVPDMQGGLKLAWNRWRGVGAQGFGQPDMPAAGDRRVGHLAPFRGRRVPARTRASPRSRFGWGLAVNAFVPGHPGAQRRSTAGNALSLTARVHRPARGIVGPVHRADGRRAVPVAAEPGGTCTPPPLYRPNIDSGMVTFDADGNLKTIDWRAFVIGLQYYLPVGDGPRLGRRRTTRSSSRRTSSALTPENSRGGVFFWQEYFDANACSSTLTPAVQLGLSYQQTHQFFGDRPFGGAHPEGKNMRSEAGLRFF